MSNYDEMNHFAYDDGQIPAELYSRSRSSTTMAPSQYSPKLLALYVGLPIAIVLAIGLVIAAVFLRKRVLKRRMRTQGTTVRMECFRRQSDDIAAINPVD